MMGDALGRHYGYDLARRASVRSGVLYPMLDRMLEDDWVTAEWELPDEQTTKRPRRYYTLTDKGRQELGAIADAALRDPTLIALLRLQS